MYFYCKYSIKTNVLSMLGAGYFLKIAKINSICPNRKKQFLQNTKNRQSAKINFRKNLVPHGISSTMASVPSGTCRALNDQQKSSLTRFWTLFLKSWLSLNPSLSQTLRWLVPVPSFLTILTLKEQNKKASQSHNSTFVELDYTMNAWLKTTIISSLAVTMATYLKYHLGLFFSF